MEWETYIQHLLSADVYIYVVTDIYIKFIHSRQQPINIYNAGAILD